MTRSPSRLRLQREIAYHGGHLPVRADGRPPRILRYWPARLPDESLRTVALWKMEGDTNKEIAERLGGVPQTVERKLRAIRKVWSDEAPT